MICCTTLDSSQMKHKSTGIDEITDKVFLPLLLFSFHISIICMDHYIETQ